MKQLLSQFIFFVIFSLLLVQFALLFPSAKKGAQKLPVSKANTISLKEKAIHMVTSPMMKTYFKDYDFLAAFSNSSFPYFLMRRAKPGKLRNPYMNFKNSVWPKIISSK